MSGFRPGDIVVYSEIDQDELNQYGADVDGSDADTDDEGEVYIEQYSKYDGQEFKVLDVIGTHQTLIRFSDIRTRWIYNIQLRFVRRPSHFPHWF